MADEAQAVPVEAAVEAQDAQPTGAEPGTKTEAAKTFTQTELDAIVTERLQRAQRKAEEQANKARTEAERKAQEEQGQYQKLAESLKAELEQERQARKAAEVAGFKRDVVARRNLPAGLAHRLQGETLEEIEADAEMLLSELPKPQAPNINAGDASAANLRLPGGMTEESIKEQAVRLGVDPKLYRQQFIRS
jgi:hypothetical protein